MGGALHNRSSEVSFFFFFNLETAAVVIATERRLASSSFIHAFVSTLYQATEWRGALQTHRYCVSTDPGLCCYLFGLTSSLRWVATQLNSQQWLMKWFSELLCSTEKCRVWTKSLFWNESKLQIKKTPTFCSRRCELIFHSWHSDLSWEENHRWLINNKWQLVTKISWTWKLWHWMCYNIHLYTLGCSNNKIICICCQHKTR